MKYLLAFCFLSLVALSMGAANGLSRECIYVEGKCVDYCPEGTHSYTTGCNQILPEATCDQPNPVLEEDTTCDYSDCYCDAPTVRDTKSTKCVLLEDCPKKE